MATPINQLPIEENTTDDELIMKEILSVQAEAAREVQEQIRAPQIIQQQQISQPVPQAISLINILKGDTKLIALVFLAVIIVEFLPINAMISKYIAIEKIPYHDILLKAAVVTIIVVFGQHFLDV